LLEGPRPRSTVLVYQPRRTTRCAHHARTSIRRRTGSRLTMIVCGNYPRRGGAP